MTSSTRESVKVAVRVRPLSSKEIKEGFNTIVRMDKKRSCVYVKNPQGEELQYTYDYVYPADTRQEEIYENTAAPIVAGCLEGFNGTIFAYGQTGTGKTYTMDGIAEEPEKRGIVPRAFEHIYDFATANAETHKVSVSVQYVELYNEEIRDLLLSSKETPVPLKLHEHPQKGFIIDGVKSMVANSFEEILKIQKVGFKHRKTRKTAMNDESSRSHSILTLVIETLTEIDGSQHIRQGRLNLVDLAGSERVKKTKVEGDGLVEAASINYALMVLGNCISALTTKSSGKVHIPYRDSALTKILRDSLGGNARTLMIANIGPAEYNFVETISTLRYAERAKKIENKPSVNMDPKDALLLELQQEMQKLQEQVKGGPIKMSPEQLKMMEEQLENERKKLSESNTLEEAEKEKLKKELEHKRRKIDREKEKLEKHQKKLEELSKYLVGGQTSLVQRTKEQDEEIQRAKENMAKRAEKQKEIEEELSKKKKRQKEMIAQCKDLNEKVKVVSQVHKEMCENYKNLETKLPLIQKQIAEDREQMSAEMEGLQKMIQTLTLVIDNFMPEEDANTAKSNFVWDKEQRQWIAKEKKSKQEILDILTSMKRPKSANGLPRPTFISGGKKLWQQPEKDEIQVLNLEPAPIENFVKNGPPLVDLDFYEEEIEKEFAKDDEADLEVQIPSVYD